MPTLVEIGPSNASQGQHRRKDAMEQIKNLTLAGSRTQVPGFSSANAITTIYIYIYIVVIASALEKPGTWDIQIIICTFLTKAACCRNVEIVLHPTTLSYI